MKMLRTLLPGLLLSTLAGTAHAELTPESCAALKSVTYPDLRVENAEFLAEATVSKKKFETHCVVTGFLEERVGTDGKAYATGFELRMPVAWNNRFFFQGGGGVDGSVRPAIGTNTRGMPDALTLGYAVASTDGGHNLGSRRDTTFGLEKKALIDYGYNSVELVATVSKALIREAYGAYPSYSYLLGSSNGGRQGLVAAMKHPNLFDGIVAGAPIKEQTRGHVATAWSLKVLGAIAPKDEKGRPLLAKAYSEADLSLISADITAQCDDLDGKRDGIVDSAKLCSYDISSLVCAADKADGCLSQDQADAFTKIHAGPVDSQGTELYAPYPYDAGADFALWHLGDAEEWPNNGRKARNTSIRNVFRYPGDPNFDPWFFDFDSDPKVMSQASQFTDATSPDLDAFALSGGKLIVYHGMGDSGPSAIDTTRWFDTVRERYGKEATDSFAKLYLLPGLGHGRTGIGPHVFPALDAIVAWVEDGKEPAMEITGGKPERTRPMCAYPTYVTWTEASQSWGCN